ncbi:DUF2637 domain-containing protein [Rhodococcus pyridinivorans]|uniref:DUF2637 domain-containing protein n=1 Tax=Rhodococcus pyridinivorans TaxID=103816 RepID=UPI003AB0D4DF
MNTIRLTRTDAALIYGLGAAALALSYTALADLAARAGLGQWQSAVWPLVVDGLIVAATRTVVTLHDGPARRYAWLLLWCAVAVSIAGNAAHLLLPPGPVHPGVATVVAVVPPVAALALTHLAIVRARALGRTHSADENMPENMPVTIGVAMDDASASPASAQLTVVQERIESESECKHDAPVDERDALRQRVRQLHAEGWSNYAIGAEVGRSEATVRRWLSAPVAS